jgi:hypothetical protein
VYADSRAYDSLVLRQKSSKRILHLVPPDWLVSGSADDGREHSISGVDKAAGHILKRRNLVKERVAKMGARAVPHRRPIRLDFHFREKE